MLCIINRRMKNSLPLLLFTALLLLTSCGKELISGISSATTTTTTTATTNAFAGSGTQGYINGTGSGAAFYNPAGLTTDAAGNIYVADYNNNVIRKITATDVVTTLAGNGTQGYIDTANASANFNLPTDVAADASGNIYVADAGNNVIRKITTSGLVITIAGSGVKGNTNGMGTAAAFSSPQGIEIYSKGNLYVDDNSNNQVRQITATGAVTTLAGKGTQGAANGLDTAATFYEPTAVAVDASGNVYVADYGNNLVREITIAGKVVTLAGSGVAGFTDGNGTAATFNGPAGIAIDAAGNLYIADYGNNAVRMITPAGVVSTVGKNSLNHPYGITVDASGNIYVSNYGNSTIQKLSR